jgi:hypothetical protein
MISVFPHRPRYYPDPALELSCPKDGGLLRSDMQEMFMLNLSPAFCKETAQKAIPGEIVLLHDSRGKSPIVGSNGYQWRAIVPRSQGLADNGSHVHVAVIGLKPLVKIC